MIAADTGGIPLVNRNDFDAAVKRIDRETSDYYVLGYYSTIPMRLATRGIEVKTTRPGVSLVYRKSCVSR